MKVRIAIVLLFLAPALFAQKKELTLDAIYDPSMRVNFAGVVQSGHEWLDDTTVIWPQRNEKGETTGWMRLDTKTGKKTSLFDRDRFQAALVDSGMAEDDARRIGRSGGFNFAAKKDSAIVEAADDLFVYSFGSGKAVRLTSSPGKEILATFSPDGRSVAFVRDHDLYVVDVASQRERRLTTSGSDKLLNGELDWVYEEEIYGRGNRKGFWWSPDSKSLAFLQTDEKPVREFTVIDHIPYRLELETYPYPKAGDPNPLVKLFTVSAAGGTPKLIDNDRYSAADFLLINVAWSGDGKALTYQIQNREQTWLELNTADPSNGSSKLLIRETTPAWVNENGNPEWLADGSFLWVSEKSGWRHLYHYNADGTLRTQVTKGEWEMRALHGVDEKNRTVYFSGTERSPIGTDIYRVGLDGSGLKRLSAADGTHSAKFNPSMTAYVDSWSDITTPPQTRLHSADGRELSILEENKVAAIAEYGIVRPEFVQVQTRDGFTMEALLIKPANLDPSKKYPVYQHTYGGPHAPQVANRWGATTMLFHNFLASQGIVVWICDNRTASGKGAVSSWPVYKNFGELELRDIEDGLGWLEKQPWVDASRIMLYGWSYGGFMTSYALTHSTKFAAGVAGGTVADWRDYDTVYTERYMLMPQNNPEGYKKASPRFSAKNLHGNLLLIHGTMDDNVHMQNTLQLVYELEKAGKPFEMKLYPKSRHGVREPLLVKDLQRTIWEFAKKNLLR